MLGRMTTKTKAKKPAPKAHKAASHGTHKPAHKTEHKVETAHHKTEAHKEEHKVHAKPAHKQAPAGAHALGAPEFVVTRKWGKPVESHVGALVRVELPENERQGYAWQLQKLPQGVALQTNERQPHAGTEGHQVTTHHRVFDFAVEEAGDYILQFDLSRAFPQGKVDTFKVKLHAD